MSGRNYHISENAVDIAEGFNALTATKSFVFTATADIILNSVSVPFIWNDRGTAVGTIAVSIDGTSVFSKTFNTLVGEKTFYTVIPTLLIRSGKQASISATTDQARKNGVYYGSNSLEIPFGVQAGTESAEMIINVSHMGTVPQTYFSFKGETSASHGLTVQTVKEPMTANVKQKIHNPAFKDGSIDFSDLAGSLKYEDKVFEYMCRFKCGSITDFNAKVAELASWLTGKGVLMTTRGEAYTGARCYSGIDIVPQFYGTFGEFSVSFVTKPFADNV